MAEYTYQTKGTCAQLIYFEIGDTDKKLHNLQFMGGCNGNLKALGLLLEGKDPKETADILRGNDCGGRGTSCADQLSIAIDQALAK